jgi:hypothetical protein
MRVRSCNYALLFSHSSWIISIQISLRSICSLALVAASVPVIVDEPFVNKPPEEWTETEALQVPNDSPWAHTVTTTVQDTQCDHEHPAYTGLFPEEMAQSVDSISARFPAEAVKPDGTQRRKFSGLCV